MSARKRSLQSFFDAARSERSPLTAESARALLSEPSSRSPLMIPTFLIGTALVLATAAGITIKIIHDNGEPQPKKIMIVEQPVADDVSYDPPTTNVDHNAQIIVTPAVSHETRNVESRTFGITVLRADDDIVHSLGLEPLAVQQICRNLAGADSMTNCSINMSDAKVKVCVFKDGNTDEVVFMDKPGPMPVMFTSSDGKGHVVASHFSRDVDPNKLVPVAAKGCGDNMVMWFQPTQDFVMSMPDDLDMNLERVVIRIENDVVSVDHNSCTPNVQRFEFLSSSNISSRVIILSSGSKRSVKRNVSQPNEHASLQETRTSQGAVAGSMLFPNPTSDGGATLSFSLTTPRTLSLSLLNLNGEKLMELARNVYRPAGDGQLTFALNNTAPGMYLVVLETELGERVVQRLIVQ